MMSNQHLSALKQLALITAAGYLHVFLALWNEALHQSRREAADRVVCIYRLECFSNQFDGMIMNDLDKYQKYFVMEITGLFYGSKLCENTEALLVNRLGATVI